MIILETVNSIYFTTETYTTGDIGYMDEAYPCSLRMCTKKPQDHSGHPTRKNSYKSKYNLVIGLAMLLCMCTL